MLSHCPIAAKPKLRPPKVILTGRGERPVNFIFPEALAIRLSKKRLHLGKFLLFL